jgi:glucose/arabinose dehydrogenase
MRSSTANMGLAALAGTALAQTGPGSYCDDLGRCFQSFTNDAGITYGFAIPETTAAPFRTIIQVTAPVSIGWAGLGWGGGMTYNPLTVAWSNGDSVIVSPRVAVGYNQPQLYGETTYTLLDGSYTNETHWVATAVCEGCSDWSDLGTTPSTLDPTGANPFVYAFSTEPVDEPNDVGSAFSIHDNVGLWDQDLSTAQSPDFEEWAGGDSPPPEETTTSVPVPTTTTTTSAPGPTGVRPIPTSCGLDSSLPLEVADGWSFVKLAGSLNKPRSVVVDKLGNLLVVQQGTGVSVHTIGTDGCISSSKSLISSVGINHGLTITPDGTQIVVSSMTTAWRYDYDAEAQSVSNQQVIIKNIQSATHSTRTVVIPPATPNLLLVSCGSNGNLDWDSISPDVARAAVKVFDISEVPEGGLDYLADGQLMGYGLRNEIAIVVDKDNMIWGVENSADEFARTVNGTDHDIHQDNPAEELNYLGDPSAPTSDWYGYPTCFTVWGGAEFPDGSPATGSQFIPAPNATFDDATCQEMSHGPRLSFQAHSAPIDGKFDADGANLYVSLHGSWNRDEPTGFKVVEIPFSEAQGEYGPTAASDSAEGYNDILWDPQEGCSSLTCFRPSGISWDADFTRMFIGSDNAREGELYILSKTG